MKTRSIINKTKILVFKSDIKTIIGSCHQLEYDSSLLLDLFELNMSAMTKTLRVYEKPLKVA